MNEIKANEVKSQVISRHLQANRVLRQQTERASVQLEQRIADERYQRQKQREQQESTAEQAAIENQLNDIEEEFRRADKVVADLKSAEAHLLNKLSMRQRADGENGRRVHTRSVELDQRIASIMEECFGLRNNIQAQQAYFQSREFKERLGYESEVKALAKELKTVKEEIKRSKESLATMNESMAGRMTEDAVHLRRLEEHNMVLKRAVKNYESVRLK